MKITVTRSGGFAGVVRRAVVDTSERDDAAEWEDLVARVAPRAASLAPGPPRPPSGPRPMPDRFVYTIEIDGQKIRVGETELTSPQRQLIRRALSANGHAAKS